MEMATDMTPKPTARRNVEVSDRCVLPTVIKFSPVFILIPIPSSIIIPLSFLGFRYFGFRSIKRKNCLNARAKMARDKFDDASLLARKTKTIRPKNSSTALILPRLAFSHCCERAFPNCYC